MYSLPPRILSPQCIFLLLCSNTIKFKCNIRVCFGQCQPENCAGYNAFGKKRRRKKRETEHEIAGTVYTGQLREEIQVTIRQTIWKPSNGPAAEATGHN